jgi:hypothetical protein
MHGPSRLVDSLHRLLQLLGTGFDLTDVFSADTTIREEIVVVFQDVTVNQSQCC